MKKLLFTFLAAACLASASPSAHAQNVTINGNQTITLSGDTTGSGTTAITTTTGKIGGQSLSLGGSTTFSGANSVTLTSTGTTNVTLPTSGTLATTATANVVSVFGRSGTVTATTGDYTVSQVTGAAPTASPTFTGSLGFPYPSTPNGRLTLTSGTPVLASTVSGATTIYWTPYLGATMWFYNGTNWVAQVCPETTNITTNSSTGNAGPAAVTTSSSYDLFMWSNSGTCTLTRGPVWTSNTARSTGTALVLQNGIYLNNVSITNGPAASRGTYVGSVCSNGSSTIDYIFGASASGGTAARFCVWNEFNRVSTPTSVIDTGTSYTYTTATIRQARASAGNQIAFMLGLQEDGVQFSYTQACGVIALQAACRFGVGFNSTTAWGQQNSTFDSAAATSITFAASNAGFWGAALGLNTLSANEEGDGTNANPFDSNSTGNLAATIRN